MPSASQQRAPVLSEKIIVDEGHIRAHFADARNNLIDKNLIQFLKNEFCFDLPLFSSSYFYKQLFLRNDSTERKKYKNYHE